MDVYCGIIEEIASKEYDPANDSDETYRDRDFNSADNRRNSIDYIEIGKRQKKGTNNQKYRDICIHYKFVESIKEESALCETL